MSKDNENKKKNIKDIEEIKEEIDDEIDDDLDDDEEKDKDYEELTTEERIFNIEKKVNIIFYLVILCTVLCCVILIFSLINNSSSKETNSNNNNNSNNSASDNNSYSYDTSAFKEISASDIKNESKNKTIVVLLGRQGCSHCAAFAPKITEVAKKFNVEVMYIDYNKIVDVSAGKIIDQNAYDIIANMEGTGSWSEFGAKAIRGTPNTLFIKNNTIIYGINGNNENGIIETAFEQAGFKK